MGCIVSCGLKLVLQIFNTVLCVAFLAVALFGFLLKFSKPVVSNLLEKIFNQFNVGDEDIRQIATFLVDNASGIAIILIIIGLALGALCLIGCIASCCGCGILLKIYAGLLLILVIAEIVAVAIVFSDPNRLSGLIVNALNKILPNYNETSDLGETSTAVWNVLMSINGFCCGMNDYTDFAHLGNTLPLQCCNGTTQTCDTNAAATAKVPGCHDKVVTFLADNMKILLYIGIGAILLQAALFVIACITIRL